MSILQSHNIIRETHTIGRRTREWIVSYGNERILRACGIQAVGWVEASDGYHVARTNPSFSLIYASMKGYGEVWINGNWHICKAGQAYLSPIGAPHAYRAVTGVPWKSCWVEGSDDLSHGISTTCLVDASSLALSHAIQGLHSEDIGPADPEAVMRWVDLILMYFRRIGHPEKSPGGRLASIWEKVVADPSFPWTMATLARETSLSEESVRRICQQEVMRAPMEYVTFLRMRSAASLIAGYPGPLAEIAGQFGYSNPFTFSTAFKRVMGVSPSQYRVERRRLYKELSQPLGTCHPIDAHPYCIP